MLRNLFPRLSDPQLDLLIDIAKRNGILPIIKKADFDWPRDLIATLICHLFSKKIFRK